MATTPRATASRLASYIKAKMKERGIATYAQLAEKAGLQRSVISYIMTTPDVSPDKRTLKKLADALDVPIEVLQALAGPAETGEARGGAGSGIGGDRRGADGLDSTTAELLRTLPGLAGLTHVLAQLSQEDREELLAIAKMKLERRGVTRS